MQLHQYITLCRAAKSPNHEKRTAATVYIELLRARRADRDDRLAKALEQSTEHLSGLRKAQCHRTQTQTTASELYTKLNSENIVHGNLMETVCVLKEKIERQDKRIILLHKKLEPAMQEKLEP